MKAIITKVSESNIGILSIEVSFKENDIEIKTENYTIANALSAIEEFKTEILTKEIIRIQNELNKGIFEIKEGDIIE